MLFVPLVGLAIGFLLFITGREKPGLVVAFASILLLLYQYAGNLGALPR